ncbi:MAG: hypothetical protein KGS61_02765 [Verrucomicrobia bacterium]|nr:hypothetical protein [Verrucomicrobiota bacterium]
MIPVGQIGRAAECYDRYNNALDPLSADAREAKRLFDDLAVGLHTAHAPDVIFLEFRYELVRQCREYLRKNRPG